MPEKIIYFFYRSILALAAPVVLFYALIRVLKNRAYAGTLPERLGFLRHSLRPGAKGAIWIHAVSVGEVLVAETLVRGLRSASSAPIFVSTTTLAGYATVRQRLPELVDGCFYAPLDYVFVIRSVLRRIEPSVMVVLETEIWPNLFREAKRAGCALLIANGRISDRAFPSYRRWRFLFRRVLRWPDAILAQSPEMRDRFVAAGAPSERVTVAGNLKFDFEPRAIDPKSPVLRWLESGNGPVWIAASTTADRKLDEDAAVLAAFSAMPDWRLIVAPRKPERFAAVAQQMGGRAFWRRSLGTFAGDERILLLDSIGELSSLFPAADVVFMGGTFTETEGHNFLEPAMAGKPLISGPRVANFQEIADDLEQHGALQIVRDANQLAEAARAAAADPGMGVRAKERAMTHRGGLERTLQTITRQQSCALFSCPRNVGVTALLTPFTWIWALGARWRIARELRAQQTLNTPVVSIGNITVGGTGKTPFVLHLAEHFRRQGLEPVVLSRGYGRSSHRDRLLLARGAEAAVWHTGDEPQILLRSGACGLGIASDRSAVGKEAEQSLHPDVFLLDDGFSHLRLARDVDIVLIDSLDAFGGGELVPLGRLREPLDSLARADIFVLTRCDSFAPKLAIEQVLAHWNGRAPIFRSRLVPQSWISLASGEPADLPSPVLAFCGLGNPRSFWLSLEQLGVHPIDRVSYGDHNQYSPRELQSLVGHARSAGAAALICTEKDVVNFPADSASIFSDLPIYWLKIATEIENESALLEAIQAGIAHRFPAERKSFRAGQSQ